VGGREGNEEGGRGRSEVKETGRQLEGQERGVRSEEVRQLCRCVMSMEDVGGVGMTELGRR
jgi:hypothetical protein